MRKWAIIPVVAFLFANSASAAEVTVKGAHLCCPSCSRAALKALNGIEGISKPAADRKTKTISFQSESETAGRTAVMSLFKAGFWGTVAVDGKEVKINPPAPKSEKVASVKIEGVHVCCGACKRAMTKLFPDATISYEGSGAQKTVTLKQADLDPAKALSALRKAGFNGKISK